MKRYLLILVMICLTVSACNAQEQSASLSGTWILTAYGPTSAPTPAVEDAEAMLIFNDDGTVTGNSGCNGFGGSYTVEGDAVTFNEIVSTLMACDDARMTQEQAIHQVLNETATFQIEGSTLTLTKNDMVLVLTR